MQRRIQPLPAQLANQIAAGEVVERPSSVVKELLENSIDAGADRIELEVEQGGTRLIRVRDNGHGILREDLPLAVAPHATSKLHSQQELEAIASLGFRGEALASIASVSRFRLASHADQEQQGWEIACEGPRVGTPQPAPLPCGTQVEVRDLFYNIPARRKFLRSPRTEFLHLEAVMRRIALSRFDVAFTLIHNGRQVLRLRKAQDAEQRARRVNEILGRGFIQRSLQLDFSAAGLRLRGWISHPDASRSQADSQFFYLNGRMIRDKLVTHALRQVHQSVLEPGRHPAYALFLEMDAAQVDVNVHPTKHEVRFRESRLVHDFIVRALRNALEGEERTAGVAQAPATDGESRAFAPPSLRPAPTARSGVAEQQGVYALAREAQADAAPLGRARAILHQRYLLAEAQDGPILLDLPALRRCLLEAHLQQMLAEGAVRSQPLLIPQSATVSAEEFERLQSASALLERLGFELEPLGEQSVVLRRIPALLHGVDGSAVLTLLFEELAQGSDAERMQKAIVRHAVAATPVTELAEAERLLRQAESLPERGAAYWRVLSLQQLQQWFAFAGGES